MAGIAALVQGMWLLDQTQERNPLATTDKDLALLQLLVYMDKRAEVVAFPLLAFQILVRVVELDHTAKTWLLGIACSNIVVTLKI